MYITEYTLLEIGYYYKVFSYTNILLTNLKKKLINVLTMVSRHWHQMEYVLISNFLLLTYFSE